MNLTPILQRVDPFTYKEFIISSGKRYTLFTNNVVIIISEVGVGPCRLNLPSDKAVVSFELTIINVVIIISDSAGRVGRCRLNLLIDRIVVNFVLTIINIIIIVIIIIINRQ